MVLIKISQKNIICVKMKIFVNDTIRKVDKLATLSSLLNEMQIKGEMIAVELNLKIIDRKDFSNTLLNEGDRIEIINFVGGGDR
ncbi:MAG: sulfur carrier protein ThiS [Nitrospirota bacterium]